MRGLTTRVEFANAVVLAAIGHPKAEDALESACTGAEMDGYSDHQQGQHEVPVMFSEVPDLVGAWRYGQMIAAEHAAVSNCRRCNDGTGFPCPAHG